MRISPFILWLSQSVIAQFGKISHLTAPNVTTLTSVGVKQRGELACNLNDGGPDAEGSLAAPKRFLTGAARYWNYVAYDATCGSIDGCSTDFFPELRARRACMNSAAKKSTLTA